MRLITENGDNMLVEPTEQQLQSAPAAIGPPGNSFAIPEPADEYSLQTRGNRADGFTVEYREGNKASRAAPMRGDLSRSDSRCGR